jgi:hypothetical protein
MHYIKFYFRSIKGMTESAYHMPESKSQILQSTGFFYAIIPIYGK